MKIAAQSLSQETLEQAAAEFALMFRAFLDKDGEIDLEEQAQLLDLREELGLTNEQVAIIEEGTSINCFIANSWSPKLLKSHYHAQ